MRPLPERLKKAREETWGRAVPVEDRGGLPSWANHACRARRRSRNRVPACRQPNFPGAQIERADDPRKVGDRVARPMEMVADGRLK